MSSRVVVRGGDPRGARGGVVGVARAGSRGRRDGAAGSRGRRLGRSRALGVGRGRERLDAERVPAFAPAADARGGIARAAFDRLAADDAACGLAHPRVELALRRGRRLTRHGRHRPSLAHLGRKNGVVWARRRARDPRASSARPRMRRG